MSGNRTSHVCVPTSLPLERAVLQLATAFADGVPCRNSKLLLLAAEGGNQELFEAVLRVLDRVAKVSVASKTNERGEQELTGRRTGGGVSPQSTSHREGTMVMKRPCP